jgi:hypothetical protein
MAFLLLYICGLHNISTASSTDFWQRLVDRLHCEFAMTNLGDVHLFLGIVFYGGLVWPGFLGTALLVPLGVTGEMVAAAEQR